jgi:hypothetical protein
MTCDICKKDSAAVVQFQDPDNGDLVSICEFCAHRGRLWAIRQAHRQHVYGTTQICGYKSGSVFCGRPPSHAGEHRVNPTDADEKTKA